MPDQEPNGARSGPEHPSQSGRGSFPRPGRTGTAASVRRGVRVGTLSSLGQQLISVVVTIVLARVLMPADFGLATMALVASSFFALFGLIGLGPLVVRQHTERDAREAASTCFWAATGLGVLLASAVAVSSEGLAGLLGDPRAAALILAMAPTLPMRMVATLPKALLQRSMSFRRMYAVDLTTTAAYGATQVALALAGFGAWAVVLGHVVASCTQPMVACVLARWTPTLSFDRALIRANLGFSGGVLSVSVLGYLTKNLDYWVVGRTLDAAALGTYYVAYVLPSIIRQRFTWVSTDVLLPVLSRAQADPVALRTIYLRSLHLHAFVGCAAMVIIAVVAGPLVELFFGPRWQDAVAPLRVLAVVALLDFLGQGANSLWLATGQPRRSVQILAVRLVAFAALLVPAAVAGTLVAFAFAALGAAVMGLATTWMSIRRSLEVSWLALLAAIINPLVMAGFAAVAVTLALVPLAPLPAAAQLAALGSLGILVYVGSGLLLRRDATLASLREVSRLLPAPR